MKDIPIFTATEGIATLILREIPTRREGYVLVRSVFTNLEALLRECERFCRSAGAERVYFGGNADFSAYPIYARLIEREVDRLPQTAARAEKITESERAQWLELYRARFLTVPAAQSSPETDNAYFVYDGDERIGLGQIEGEELRAVTTLKRGTGADCVAALAAATHAARLYLLCAEENLPAMRLYDRMGFTRGRVREVWHCRAE